MSVNISIEEGGVARQFTADELQTEKVGGGSQDWVPKNEVQLIDKRISENGTYKAKDDGAYGYNIVTVNVEPKLTTKNVSENGTYKAESDGADGFKIVSVNVEPKLTTKNVSENGTYKAEDYGADGFNIITGNVPGGNGSSNNSGKPSGTDVTHTKPDGGLDLDGITPPGGAGSAIVGTDPETGNEVAVGVDKDGNIVKTDIPSGIWVRTPPTKVEYVEGETIIFDGMVVSPIKKDQSTFVDERYSAGKIPFEELIFPVKVAPEGGSGGYTSDLDLTPYAPPLVVNSYIRFGSHSTTPGVDYDYDITCLDGANAVCWWDNSGYIGWVGFIIASDSVARFQEKEYRYGTVHSVSDGQTSSSYTYDGKTVYYTYSRTWHHGYEGCGFQSGVPLNGVGNPTHPEQVAWTIVYGTPTGGTAKIPVQWKSPYDGREMEDTFEITVTSAPEGAGGGGSF